MIMFMSDQPESLVLVYLRRIDEKLDRAIDDLNGLKTCTTGAEEAIVGLNKRLDRIDLRLDRIEKRFDLVDA